MLLGDQNGSHMQFQILFPHSFTARIRAASSVGTRISHFSFKMGVTKIRHLVRGLIQNGDHFGFKKGHTFDSKQDTLLDQKRTHFWSRKGNTFGPKKVVKVLAIYINLFE